MIIFAPSLSELDNTMLKYVSSDEVGIRSTAWSVYVRSHIH